MALHGAEKEKRKKAVLWPLMCSVNIIEVFFFFLYIFVLSITHADLFGMMRPWPEAFTRRSA